MIKQIVAAACSSSGSGYDCAGVFHKSGRAVNGQESMEEFGGEIFILIGSCKLDCPDLTSK